MRIETAQNVGIDVEVAGVGDRVLAALVDYLILGSAFVGLLVLFSWLESAAVAVLGFVLLGLYFPLTEIFLNGQTVGKRVRHIKVARVDGGEPTVGNYVLRWLVRLVEVDLTYGTVALVTILVNGRGQRLGDLAAGTTVVRVRPRVALDDTLYAPVSAAHTPTFPQVERLTDADIETAKEVLHLFADEGGSPTAGPMGARLKAVFEARMGLRSDLPPDAFLRAVVQDYNHLHGRL